MTQISAKIVADSLNTLTGDRITTMEVVMPRYILAEFNTHRMFSRNSASSRAIPFKKMVESVKNNPFIPIAFQRDHSGMQGSEYLVDLEDQHARDNWKLAMLNAVKNAETISGSNITKQLANRLLEPFMYHKVLVTATEWENFFALRCPQYGGENRKGVKEYYRSKKDAVMDLAKNGVNINNLIKSSDLEWLQVNEGQADIHMMALAEAMWDEYNESKPKELQAGEWHIPYEDQIDDIKLTELMSKEALLDATAEEFKSMFNTQWNDFKIKIATAMCARVSYTVVGEEAKAPNYENDIKLHDRLIASGHMSPTEHIGRCMSKQEHYAGISGEVYYEEMIGDYPKALNARVHISKKYLGWSGNFKGFISYRKMIPGEAVYKNI